MASAGTTESGISMEFLIGGDLPVRRLGFGAQSIAGPESWGPPADRAAAVVLLRRAVELGMTFIDTADSYGPYVSEETIREALHPYDGVTIATKGGLTRPGPDDWEPRADPEYLRSCVEGSLRRLGIDRIDLYQLHRVDPAVPMVEQLGTLAELQREGKIRHLGLSAVTVEQIEIARNFVEVASVQNRYNLGHRTQQPVVDYCADEGIAFIAYNPLVDSAGPVLEEYVAELGRTPRQVSLAWLLHRSPALLPIPGTSSLPHLEENAGALDIELTSKDLQALIPD